MRRPPTLVQILRKQRQLVYLFISKLTQLVSPFTDFTRDIRLNPYHTYATRLHPNLPKEVVTRFKEIDQNITGYSSSVDIMFVANMLWDSRHIPGIIVECGCAEGNSTAKLSILAQHLGKQLVVFDSFQGLPDVYDYHYKYIEEKTGQRLMDTEGSGEKGWYPTELFPGDKWSAKSNDPLAAPNHLLPEISRGEYKFKTGSFSASKDLVIRNIERFGEPTSVQIIEGWFEDTLGKILTKLDQPVSAAFVDVDLLRSHEECFHQIWPKTSIGGDYFSHESQSKAIRDFYRRQVGEFRVLFQGRKRGSHLMYFRKKDP